jgi:uncharacterized membrane protein HdeD (DUF308 family)
MNSDIQSTKSRRRVRLWQLLLAVTVLSVGLALLPNHRLSEMIFVSFVGVMLLVICVLLVIIILKKLFKR